MTNKVMHGARAKVYVDNQLVGIYDSCNYGVNLGTEPVHILGRFNPAEIAYTSYEAISLTCSGFRVVGQGVHVLPKFPKLQDLLNFEDVTLSIVDRQSNELIMTAIGCKPASYSTGQQQRATTKFTITYTGIALLYEEGAQNDAGAANLP